MSGAAREPAPDRIDLRSRADVDRWTKQLGVSPEELAKVVEIAGDRASDVADYLKQHGRPATSE